MIKEGVHPGDPERVVATSETDARGIAGFNGVPPGKYGASLGAEHSIRVEEMVREGAIEVESGKAEKTEVSFRWPEKSYAARHLRGWLMVKNQPDGERVPLDLGLVQLLDWGSGKVIAQTYTNSKGYYELPSEKSGAYWVRITEKPDLSSSTYDMAAVVSDDAGSEHLSTLEVDPCSRLSVY